MMRVLYELYFEREYEYREDTQLCIGLFETQEEAQDVITQLEVKAGFCDFPDGFVIYEKCVGMIGWQEGFETKPGPPPKDAAAEYFDIPAWMESTK
jgi:hypothetical protein